MQKEILLGLIGHPVSHSISPVIHKALLFHSGLKGDYELLDVESKRLSSAILEFKSKGYTGLNVTIPHKVEVMKYLDRVDEKAQAVGAINTIHFESEKNIATGYNTDIDGFLEALAFRKISVSNALVYGYGGAARACILALSGLDSRPDKILLTGRNMKKASSLLAELSSLEPFEGSSIEIFDPDHDSLTDDLELDLFINASPIGQTVGVTEQYRSLLKKFSEAGGDKRNKLLFDLVYAKDPMGETESTSLAKEIGIDAVDGREMLVRQAIKSFQIWTGKSVPLELLDIF